MPTATPGSPNPCKETMIPNTARENRPPILSTVKLSRSFSDGGTQHHALKNLDLQIKQGDFTIIMGPSGAGKSTLLYALSGMDRPTLGKIYFDGHDISSFSDDELAVFRRKHCGFVFQQIYLIDSMSLMDNVLASGRLLERNTKKLVVEAKNLFEQVGVDKDSWSRFPSQVSGGEAQRVGIVRALINHPQVVFADEPTGALNSSAGDAVLDMMTAINRGGQSVVMVTHDLNCALRGNRILYLTDGRICGELDLTPYEGADKERRTMLHDFLEHLGW